MEHEYIFQLAIIFFGSAVVGTLFIWLKQPVILAYIMVGLLAGPYGFKAITNVENVHDIGKLGIVFLLFLLGLNLPLRKLITLFKQSAVLSAMMMFVLSSSCTALCYFMGFDLKTAIYIGVSLMFSSTVIGLKLIPTTALHHQRIGAILTSVLLFEDLVAIFLILLSMSAGGESSSVLGAIKPLISLLLVIGGAFYSVKYILLPLFMKYDTVQEYMFLLSLGWCFLVAEVAYQGGVSHEIGAFIAGTALATSPIALLISERLKPIREFFLIMFFFAVGARFNYQILDFNLILLGMLLVAIVAVLKPILFGFGFRLSGEPPRAGKELGIRLGNAGEFGLLLGASYFSVGMISTKANVLINFVVIISFIISTYNVVSRYPTPISSSDPVS